MTNNKMRAFAVMIATIAVATVASVNIFSEEKRFSAFAQSIDENRPMSELLELDEAKLMGKDETLSAVNVIDELENMMTYDDELAFKTVTAQKGQIVMCSYGCSEIMLISGTAKVYSIGDYGFINITNGLEYGDEMEINRRQLFIMPEPDKSGAVVTSDEAAFLIRGGYEIKK